MNFSKIKRLVFLIRNKGFKYTYNFLWYYLLWGSEFFRKLFLIKLFPWFVFYPSFIEVEVTTRCHMRCIMCEHTYWKEPPRDMSFEDFKRIIDQFPRLKWLGLTGIGESFLNKDFLKMLEFLKERPIFVEIFDTFYHIDERMARRLIELDIDHVYASVDAATKETYERIRVGSNFERVINNIRNFIRLKRETNSPFPRIDFHYIISKANIHEIPQFIELVNSIREEEEVGIQFTGVLHEFEAIKELMAEVPEEVVQKAERRAKELGIKLAWNKNIPQDKEPINQCTNWSMPFIFVTGQVIPCCAGNEANRREFQKEHSFGNVFQKPFKEIWYSGKYKRFRQMVHRGEVPIQCKNCTIFDTDKR